MVAALRGRVVVPVEQHAVKKPAGPGGVELHFCIVPAQLLDVAGRHHVDGGEAVADDRRLPVELVFLGHGHILSNALLQLDRAGVPGAVAGGTPGGFLRGRGGLGRLGLLLVLGELAQGVPMAPRSGLADGGEPESCILAGTFTRRDFHHVGPIGGTGNLVDIEHRLPEAVRLLRRAVGTLREMRQRARPDIGHIVEVAEEDMEII